MTTGLPGTASARRMAAPLMLPNIIVGLWPLPSGNLALLLPLGST